MSDTPTEPTAWNLEGLQVPADSPDAFRVEGFDADGTHWLAMGPADPRWEEPSPPS